MTTSAKIIDFISTLHGMDRLQRVDIADQRPGAFDMLTAQAIEADDTFPDGETLIVDRFHGQRVKVQAHLLLDALILRSAQARSITQGGSVKDQYDALKEHLEHKTGFSY